MQITINNKAFEILDIIDEASKTVIYVDKSVNIEPLINIIKGKITISVTDNTTEYDLSGTYASFYVIETQRDKYIEAFKKAEPTPDTVAQLNEQITNLELALCELYESQEV